ncbi:MAG: cell wall hydrolase [Alphaproteobacteria bacterium]
MSARKDPGTQLPRDLGIEILARTLYGEARGETVRGKEAVAAVIVNRVHRARQRGGYWWGDTLENVCLKPWQFSCWNEGDPNRAKIEAVTPDNRVFQSCIRIARRAAAGALEDPTNNATHYHGSHANPPWARGQAPSAVIGRHLFYASIE